MIPEQNLRDLNQTLKSMKCSIELLQARYAPESSVLPEQRSFPVPQPGQPFEMNRQQPSTPLDQPEGLQPKYDSRWKPSRRKPSVFPPAIPPNRSVPSLQGPEFLPPSPSGG